MNSAMMVLRFGAAFVLVAVVIGGSRWVVAAPSLASPLASVSVTTIDGAELLSVTAQKVSLWALFSEVARRVGFKVTGRGSTERLVSVEFSGIPLDQALRKLLAGEGFIFLYDQPSEGGPAKLRRVILLGSGSSAQESTNLKPEADLANQALMMPAAVEPAAILPDDAETFDPDGSLEDLLPGVAHQDPRMRTSALEALTLHDDDERARRALMERIADPDPHVRTVVVGLLGPFLTQWPGAEEVVLTAALQDPAPGVRQLALLILSEASSSQTLEALHRARQDADLEVRARAEELLHDIANEAPNDQRPR
jgi:hypothetical protein